MAVGGGGGGGGRGQRSARGEEGPKNSNGSISVRVAYIYTYIGGYRVGLKRLEMQSSTIFAYIYACTLALKGQSGVF